MLWIFTSTVTCVSITLLKATGKQYNRMNYLPVQSLLAQYNVNSKQLCVGQCAQLSSTCNITVFNRISVPRCILYGESLTVANLVPSPNTIVVDFRHNNSITGRNNN